MKKISAVAMVFVVVAVALLLTVMEGLNGVSAQTGDYDADNDGLIEITYLEQLDAIRWDLNGDGVVDEGADADGYSTAFPGAIARMGCPQSGCEGYELARSLDFDDAASYSSGAVNTSWRSGVGWLPIGTYEFEAVFEGNDRTIANLFINRSGEGDPGVAGLFRVSDGIIRNVGLLDVDITGGGYVGGLVGFNDGRISSSYATGSVSGNDIIGGLVGANYRRISSSYATGSVTGNYENVGGLVGVNDANILSSYATGNVSGSDDVGGLVGANYRRISSSYATGSVTGDGGVGGLVGANFDASNISSSYATGNVSGRISVGGLVGYNKGDITASYSIGNVSGNAHAGGLVGENVDNASVIDGYWNTETSGQSEGVGKGSSDGAQGRTTAELQAPTGYTGIYAPWHLDLDNADGDSDPTTGRDDFWDFGTSSQYPALKVDFNEDGTATWQEFGNQYRGRPAPARTPTPTVSPTPQPIFAPTPISTPTASPTSLPILVPTHTPTPVNDQDMLNRLFALEGLVAAHQSRLNASEAIVITLRDRLSASEAAAVTLQNALVVLQNRVIALEAGIPEPIATPTLTPTPTPTPTPPSVREPTSTPTPQPPAVVSHRSQVIDDTVKAHIEGVGEPAKDAEIVSACRHLRGSSWDFLNLPLATPDRDYDIAAAIFLNTSSAFEMQMYCDEKQGI